MTKFSDEPITKDEIKELLIDGCGCKEISDAFGIPWQRVAAIKGVLLKPRRDPRDKANLTRVHK